MKAVVCPQYGPPEVLQLMEVPKPVPQDNEIRIKICATTVSMADFRVRSFTVPLAVWIPARIFLGLFKPKNAILGAELSGVVDEVGSHVKRFKKGDEVFALSFKDFGAYAQYKCLAEDADMALKPAAVTHEEAAAIPIGALTALHYLQKAKVKKGQKVMVYGASGSVGTYAVQISKHLGAEVTAVCSQTNIELLRALGADKVIDYTQSSFTQKLEHYDLIFIAIDKLPFATCVQHLKDNGTYVNITAPIKSLSMIWTSLTSKRKIMLGEHPNKSSENLKKLIQLVALGVLKPVIDKTYTLEQIVEAHRYVEKGHKKGNVIVKVD